MSALDQILYWASVNHHPIYDKYLEEKHEEEYGPHFNEERALCAVHDMRSVNGIGEHWTIEEVHKAIEPYKSKMHEYDTCWDAYVALHVFYHDLYDNYARRGQNAHDLIDDAMKFFFCDEDAAEGKIWHYICAM